METITKAVYVSSDGVEFDNESDCQNRENLITTQFAVLKDVLEDGEFVDDYALYFKGQLVAPGTPMLTKWDDDSEPLIWAVYLDDKNSAGDNEGTIVDHFQGRVNTFYYVDDVLYVDDVELSQIVSVGNGPITIEVPVGTL